MIPLSAKVRPEFEIVGHSEPRDKRVRQKV